MTRGQLLRLIQKHHCIDVPISICNPLTCPECAEKVLTEYDDEIYNKALDDFIQYAYVKGIDFSFMGRIIENGGSDVPMRLKKIKDDFLEQKKGAEENG